MAVTLIPKSDYVPNSKHSSKAEHRRFNNSPFVAKSKELGPVPEQTSINLYAVAFSNGGVYDWRTELPSINVDWSGSSWNPNGTPFKNFSATTVLIGFPYLTDTRYFKLTWDQFIALTKAQVQELVKAVDAAVEECYRKERELWNLIVGFPCQARAILVAVKDEYS